MCRWVRRGVQCSMPNRRATSCLLETVTTEKVEELCKIFQGKGQKAWQHPY